MKTKEEILAVLEICLCYIYQNDEEIYNNLIEETKTQINPKGEVKKDE